MNCLNDMHQDTSFDNSPWDKQETGRRLESFSTSYTKDLGTNEKSKDISCIYNEFLKNTLDFSETPVSYADKLDDNIFFCGSRPRKDFELIKTNINRKLVDFFKSEQELESDLSSENKPTNMLESFENIAENPISVGESRFYIDDSVNQNVFMTDNQPPPQQQLPIKIPDVESLQEEANVLLSYFFCK